MTLSLFHTVYRSASARAMLLVLMLIGAGASGILTAQPTSRKLRLLAPEGGTTFKAGDTVVIVWSGTGNAVDNHRQDTVSIELSVNNGKDWQPVGTASAYRKGVGQGYDSTFRWVVPNAAGKGALLRVRQIRGNFGEGDSIGSAQVLPLSAPARLTPYFSDVDSLLVVNGGDSIQVWDIFSRRMIWADSIPKSRWRLTLDQFRFALDDSLVVAGVGSASSGDTGFVFVWGLRSGNLKGMFPARVANSGAAGVPYLSVPRSGSVSPDGSRLMVAGTFEPAFWSLATGSSVGAALPAVGPTYSGDFSPDGGAVALGVQGSAGTLVSTWDIESRQRLHESPALADFVQYSADGRYILAAGYGSSGSRPTTGVYILDAVTGDSIFFGYGYEGRNGRFAQRSSRFIAGGAVFDMRDGIYYQQIARDDEVRNGYAVTPSGTIVAVVAESGAVTLKDITGIPIASIGSGFALDGTLPLVVDRFLGTLEVGTSKDTVIEVFITNGAAEPVTIEGTVLKGGEVADFMVISGGGAHTLPAGASAPIGLRFSPRATGLRTARLEVSTGLGPITAEISGVGYRRISGTDEEGRVPGGAVAAAMSVHPNPALDRVSVRYVTSLAGNVDLHLFDMTGRLLDRRELGYREPGSYETFYDMPELRSGAYRLELRAGAWRAGETILVVR